MAGVTMRKLTLILPVFLLLAAAPAPDSSSAQGEFFEKKIRPLLIENCYKCHSSTSEKLKGSLKLDSREAALKGGESGKPAITPGDREKSLLIEAVRYSNPDLQMPPRKQLSAQQIADLTEWVRIGAPYPTAQAASPTSLQPAFPASVAPNEWPIPTVKNKSWPTSPIDNFV